MTAEQEDINSEIAGDALDDCIRRSDHNKGLVTDEDMTAIVIDRMTEEERVLAEKIFLETDEEALEELLASPLCCPKIIDYMQERLEHTGGDSSLLRAAKHLQVDKIRLLLEAGANPNVNDLFDMSALHMVLKYESAENEQAQEIIQLLIEYGYDASCVDAEKKMTAFEFRLRPESQEDGEDAFGEGIYEAFDVVPWSEIEAAILTETSTPDEDHHRGVVQIVRRLVDLGWGPGADKDAVKGKERRKMVLERTAYLYYWDDRDGDQYEGWWIAAGLGSNNYFFSNIGRNDTPPRKGNWSKPETDLIPIYEDEVEEGTSGVENGIPVVGYRLDNLKSAWHDEFFKLTEQTFHGKPVYSSAEQGTTTKLEDRCTLLVDKVLLPLLHLAAQERLEDTDEAPCKTFARYLLASRVASVCQEKVLEASNEGLDLLEKVLVQCYVEVGPALDSSCGPKKTMVGHYVEWDKMNQHHVHRNLDWMEATDEEFMWKSLVVLCQEGYTLEDICDAFSALAWTSKEAYRSGVYALWLIKVAELCNESLVKAIQARIDQKDKEDKDEQVLNAHIYPGPIKGYRRILEKRTDYRSHVFNGRNYDVGGVADIARLSLACDTPADLIHCFKAITEANLDEHGFEVVRIKNGFSSANVNPKGGYRDVKFNLRVRGPEGGDDTIAEVQLLLQKFLDVKKHMHLLYEVVRGSYF